VGSSILAPKVRLDASITCTKQTHYVRLSTVVKAWRDIPVGSPVYALDDAVRAKDRLQEALVQRIDFQVEYGTSGVNRGMVMCPCE